MIPRTVACQTPSSRQEYWSGWPFPSPGNFLDSGINPKYPALQVILYCLSHQGGPEIIEQALLSTDCLPSTALGTGAVLSQNFWDSGLTSWFSISNPLWRNNLVKMSQECQILIKVIKSILPISVLVLSQTSYNL